MNKKPPFSELQFLRLLSKAISPNDFQLLSDEAGFLPPVSFDIEKLRTILRAGSFPLEDLIEYSWALFECEFSRLAAFSDPVRIFVSSVFAHCNFHQPLGTHVESNFYWLGVESTIRSGDHKLSFAFCDFLERLESSNSAGDENQRYFCSLALSFLRSGVCSMHGADIERRVALLEFGVKGKADSDLTDSLVGLQPWRSISPDLVGGKNTLHRLMLALPGINGAEELNPPDFG
jgi:hypothetical protein